MNKTYSKKYEDFIFYENSKSPHLNQTIYRFGNGYGASVVYGKFSYGLEIVVIQFYEDDWEITYDTPVTNNVISYVENLDDVLDLISKL